MAVFEVGRVCMKLAGRDAGRKCVVLSDVADGKVLVDGATRRRSVNVNHLEPMTTVLDIAADASHEDVAKAFEAQGVKVLNTKAKKASDRPKKSKKVKAKKSVAPKKDKKAAKKAEAKESKKESKKSEEKKAETKAAEGSKDLADTLEER